MEPIIGGAAAMANGADLIKNSTTASFMADVIDASHDGAGDRRFLGAVVRAVQAARPGAREGGERGQAARCGWSRSTSTRTRDRAADAHPVDPRGLCLQGRPAGRRLRRRGAGEPGEAVRRAGWRAAPRRPPAPRPSRRRSRWPRRRWPPATRRAPPTSSARCWSTSRAMSTRWPGCRAAIARKEYAKARADARPRRRRKPPTMPRSPRRAPRSKLAEAGEKAAGALGELRPAPRARTRRIMQARLDLASALFASGEREQAIDELLDIVKRDRDWNEQAARKQLRQVLRGDRARPIR